MWILFWAWLSLSSNAFEVKDCTPIDQTVKNLRVQRFSFTDSTTCYVTVDPAEAPDLIYRSFLFTSEGELMVFNSYGEGEESETTAARVYFFLPRGNIPQVAVDFDKALIQVIDSSGESVIFDGNTQKVISMGRRKFVESLEISPKNRGGLEVLGAFDVWLDGGFQIGHDPISNSKGTALVHSANNSCKIKNSEIFEYRPQDPSWEVKIKYSSDSELRDYVSKICQ